MIVEACVQTPLYTGYMIDDWRASVNGPKHPTKYFIAANVISYAEKNSEVYNQMFNQGNSFLWGGGGEEGRRGVISRIVRTSEKNPGYAPDNRWETGWNHTNIARSAK